MLRGGNQRKRVSVGSLEPMARRSSSVDWSDEVVSGAADDTDHLSLMDPYYDLTRARLTKLFNFFAPDGEICVYQHIPGSENGCSRGFVF